MKPRHFLIILIIFIFQTASSQRLSFFSEDLTFNLTDEYFEVGGWYHFRNNTSDTIRQMLFYPFPNTADYGNISFIKIHSKHDTANLVATKSEKGCIFRLKIPPAGEESIWINYRQTCKNNQAKYIITSTQAWEQSFETATYELEFPADFKSLTSNIPPDSIAEHGNLIRYFWNRKDFMPTRDFEFRFTAR